MESRPNRIQQAYGYIVCLIAIVTILISVNSVVRSVFDRMRPNLSDRYMPSRTFEDYKLQRLGQIAQITEKSAAPIVIPPDSVLRRDYDEEVRRQRDITAWGANKSLTTSIIVLIIATLFFVFHWRWVRRISDR